MTQEQIQAIQKLVVAGNETKIKKVKLNVLCNSKNIHVKVHITYPSLSYQWVLNYIDAIIKNLALFSMTPFKMEAIEQELKHLSKKKKIKEKGRLVVTVQV